jgi:hypothetical protein
MAVTHNFECAAHGAFEARVEGGEIPWCPRGCSPSFVQLVFLTPPNISSARVRVASQLVREMADIQGLSDIDTSPSRPGDSVADRNFKRSGNAVRAQALPMGNYIAGMTHRANELVNAGFGNRYNPQEWSRDPKTGKARHVASPPLEPLPMNQYGVSVSRVREKL